MSHLSPVTLTAAEQRLILRATAGNVRDHTIFSMVRPIFHHRDDTSIGHIVASFLALRLELDLDRRLDERGVRTSWPDQMRDLERVHAVVVDLDGKRFLLRTDLVGHAHEAFAAAGVRPPTLVTPIGPSPPMTATLDADGM